jgi:hypothetical protein
LRPRKLKRGAQKQKAKFNFRRSRRGAGWISCFHEACWQNGRFWTAAGSAAPRRFRTDEKLSDNAASPYARKRCRRSALPAQSKIFDERKTMDFMRREN